MERHSPHNLFTVFGCFFLTCWSSLAFAVPNFGPVNMETFYATLPSIKNTAKVGSLVKSEKIAATVPNAQAWKIAYVSSDVNGKKTLVTGIVAAPIGPVRHADRPIMAWAHGTTGTAQTCGPSQVLDPAQPLNQYFSIDGNSWTDFGLPGMSAFIKAGYVIVATDYQGLGGGGKHQYTVAATQARDVINSIRAVTFLKEAGAGQKAVIYGWSQGGGATIAAAGLSDYLNKEDSANKNIKLVGFVAMAPFDIAVTFPNKIDTDAEAEAFLQKLINGFSANVFDFTHYVQNIWGMVAAFPQLKLEDTFTSEGAKAVNTILARKCMHVAADTFDYVYKNNYKTLLRSNLQNPLTWIEAYRKSSVVPVKPIAPVIIYWGNHDVTVPPIMGELYFKQMCKLGGNVTRVQLPGNQTHFTTPTSAEPLYVRWVADRFAGKPATNGC